MNDDGTRTVRHVLCRGNVNKNFRVTYSYKLEKNDAYSTVWNTGNLISIAQAFSINLSEGREQPSLFVPSSQYFLFVALLHKSIPLIQSHLHELYPKLGEDEFDMDLRVLERFMFEKAMRAGGTTITPNKWVDPVGGKCYPSLKMDGMYGGCNVPLEDCIAMDQMFMTFDPNTFGLIALNMLYDGG